jgi:epoxide hydrolase-like predicted phosphatase
VLICRVVLGRGAPLDESVDDVPIRAVAFDVGGVLTQVGHLSSFRESWRERLGLTQAGFSQALASVDPGELALTGLLSEAQYKGRLAAALGLSAVQADEFLSGMSGDLDAGLCNYAASLRPRFTTAILSDAVAGARRVYQARYGFDDLVDVIIYSCEVGLAKPDPRIYQLLCDRLAVAPSELVFLDDRPENVHGARELGLHAVLHENTAQSIKALGALLAA